MVITKLDGNKWFPNTVVNNAATQNSGSISFATLDKYAKLKPLALALKDQLGIVHKWRCTAYRTVNSHLISAFKIDRKIGDNYLTGKIELVDHIDKNNNRISYDFIIAKDGEFYGDPITTQSTTSELPKFIKQKCSFNMKNRRLKLKWDEAPGLHCIKYDLAPVEKPTASVYGTSPVYYSMPSVNDF